MDEKIVDARKLIADMPNITVLTGAGISAESGIPTFRGEDGLWKNFRPEDIATPQAFLNDPRLVWDWYEWRRKIIREAKPNAGHFALVELQKQLSNFTLITQNIDGLHQIAGSTSIIELHGNLWQVRCTKCGFTEQNYEVPLRELPPNCRQCKSIARPNVVWFGEIIPMSIIDKCLIAIESCQIMLIIGTSGVVEPAASMGLIAKQTGKTVIEINLDVTPSSGMYDISIRGKSGEILPLICQINKDYN